MNILDAVIILTTLAIAFRSWHLGIFRQVFALAGFWAGLFLGAYLAQLVLGRIDSPVQKLLLTLVITLGSAFLLTVLGEYIGFRISQAARAYKIRWADAILGAVSGGLTSLLAFWLLGSVAITSPIPSLRQQIATSRVLTALTESLPPAPAVIAQIERAIHASEFPQVFVGVAPAPAPPVQTPGLEQLQGTVDAAKASVVKIEGVACREISFGSGFVAADNLVVTNAHVVAGVKRPIVHDAAGTHQASVIFFDPDLDLAILRTTKLAGAPLTLVTGTASRGTQGAVLGYPGGGDFTAVPAAVLQQLVATGRDIYNRSVTVRTIYELQAQVISGNSGGPIIDTEGSVVGVVFGRSETDDGIGYALMAKDVQTHLAEAKDGSQSVSTGSCLAN